MKFERLKSILLVFLVISSIVLTVNKWFNEKLWPEGYNFFSHVKNYFTSGSAQSQGSSFDPIEEVLKPEKIILNNSGNHVLYTKSSQEYESLFDEIKSSLELLHSSKEQIKTDNNDWNDALKRKSCYFSYPVEYDSGYFNYQLSNSPKNSLISVREFIIVPDTRVSTLSYIYAKDSTNSEFYKYPIEFKSTTLDDMINNVSKISGGTDYYSFELKFDVKSDDVVKQHVVISPDVLINVTPTEIPSIFEQNVFEDISNRPDIYNGILQTFGYNTSTIRRYTEHDNSMVFVENFGTIKLHTDASLEYKSVNLSQGVSLSGDTTYDCINSSISFVNTVTNMLGFPKEMYYEISSDIKDINSKTFTLNFDYYINDRMIVFPEKHAITLEVVSGKIVSYRQECKTFYTLGEPQNHPSAIEAIDILNSRIETREEIISDLFTAYAYNSINNSWVPVWYIEKENGELHTITSNVEVVQ